VPEIRTDFDIHASADAVWNVLADFPSYPSWNPFLVKLKGDPLVGSPLGVHVKSGPLKVVFPTTVLVANPGRELRWRGHFLSDGIVAGEHYFLIEPIEPNKVHFVHGEKFTGALSTAAWAVIGRSTRRGYAAMNPLFKARVESLARQAS
jgi:hypothetical protein